MADEGLSKEAQLLLANCIDSVGQLEMLLLSFAHGERTWTGAEVAAELRIDPVWAGAQLARLAATGLLQPAENPEPAYRYAPRTPELARAVAALARDYAERRVSVIAAIYSKPTDKLRAFADAFRIRTEGGE